jgi:hypothetical protein
MFETEVLETIKTHVLCSLQFSFSFENCAVHEIMWKKYCRAGEATDDNMIHAHYMLDNSGYTRARAHARTHALRISNTYCFSTVTMDARTRLIVML